MLHGTKESSLQKSPTDSLLAQLAEHGTDDQEVVSQTPWGQFLMKFILFCVTLNLSDNMTENSYHEKLNCEMKLLICNVTHLRGGTGAGGLIALTEVRMLVITVI